jgi:hypothetical protein
MNLFVGPAPAEQIPVEAQTGIPAQGPQVEEPELLERAALPPLPFQLADPEEPTEVAVKEIHPHPQDLESSGAESQPEPVDTPKPKEHKRTVPPSPPVDLPELRKAVTQILPLLADQDPGAKDCLKANRTAFRCAFAPEAYAEFEQLVKGGSFTVALENLKKAAKRHGISM